MGVYANLAEVMFNLGPKQKKDKGDKKDTPEAPEENGPAEEEEAQNTQSEAIYKNLVETFKSLNDLNENQVKVICNTYLSSGHPQTIYLKLKIQLDALSGAALDSAKADLKKRIDTLLADENVKNPSAKNDLLFGVLLMNKFKYEVKSSGDLMKAFFLNNYQEIIPNLLNNGVNTKQDN